MTAMTSQAAPQVGVVRTGSTRRSQGVALCTGMMRGAMLCANVALLASLAAGFLLEGPLGLANAAVAGALVLVFFATGQGVQLIATQMADGAGLLLLLGSFVARAAAMGAVLWLAMGHSAAVEPVLRRTSLMVGAATVVAGWLVGVLVTGSRQRVYAYDKDYDAAREGGVGL